MAYLIEILFSSFRILRIANVVALSPLQGDSYRLYEWERGKTIVIAIDGRETTIERSMEKRSYESMYKTDTKTEAKRLRATISAVGGVIFIWKQ